jgi:hypothetical protein
MMSDDKCLLPCIEAWSLKKEYQILKNPEGIFNPDPDRSQNVNPGGLKHVLHSLHNLKLDSWFCAVSMRLSIHFSKQVNCVQQRGLTPPPSLIMIDSSCNL